MTQDESNPKVDEQISAFNAGVRKLLNMNGHAFHHSVMQHVLDLVQQGALAHFWRLHAVEFPVTVNEHDTRVDFVLEHGNKNNYIVAECKRQAPQTCWVFYAYTDAMVRQIRLPMHTILAERLEQHEPDLTIYAQPGHISMKGTICHGSLVLPRWPGDKLEPGSRNAIDEASAQVIRGVNGLMEQQAKLAHGEKLMFWKTFIPVVVTNAELRVTDVDLTTADKTTGELPPDSVTTKAVPWVFYHFPVSPTLKHSLHHRTKPNDLQMMLRSHFLRTVVVINPAGIEEFMHAFDNGDFDRLDERFL